MEVVAVNRQQAICVLFDGTIFPFTNMFDAQGEETNDGQECTRAVAHLPNGQWVVVYLDQFDPVATQ